MKYYIIFFALCFSFSLNGVKRQYPSAEVCDTHGIDLIRLYLIEDWKENKKKYAIHPNAIAEYMCERMTGMQDEQKNALVCALKNKSREQLEALFFALLDVNLPVSTSNVTDKNAQELKNEIRSNIPKIIGWEERPREKMIQMHITNSQTAHSAFEKK